MQERFRFRAWDRIHKVMHYNVEMDDKKRFFSSVLQNDCFVLMQSTGLKDRNGKLIYEGDILCHPQLPHKVVVEWFQCGFWLNGYQNGAKRSLHDVCKFYEVIGNIYDGENKNV